MSHPLTTNKHAHKLSEAASVLDIPRVSTISPTNLLDDDDEEYRDSNPHPILSQTEWGRVEHATNLAEDMPTQVPNNGDETRVDSLGSNHSPASLVITNEDAGLAEADIILHTV